MEYPVSRKFVAVDSSEGKGFQIKVLSYNILAQTGLRRESYTYASSNCLKWNYRKNILFKEVSECGADIICLQECDTMNYKKFWKDSMENKGFASYFRPKTVKMPDQNYGIAIFYLKDKFESVLYEDILFDELAKGLTGDSFDEMNRSNVGQLLALKLKPNVEENLPKKEDRGILIGNLHLFWHPKYDWVRMKQVDMILQRMVDINKKLNFSCILAGDFNSTPTTRIYKFLTRKVVEDADIPKFMLPEDHHDPKINHIDQVVSADLNGTLHARVSERKLDEERVKEVKSMVHREYPKLISAYGKYTELTGAKPAERWTGEPAYTNFTDWKGTLDYIFLVPIKKEETNSTLIRSILEIPNEEVMSKHHAIPSDVFPSDHISIMAVFEIL